ncbi:hypothetical protein HCUR_01246 [Holospora curviuscula]|uniref:Uncharacterized protein n=1 Tax=Holospora curviuscula TaxID=1082868 RepID=A0A2S5R807_9PROT|nr:hypothetical protein HCUR_01246 [Holospora curviuscula]
MRDDQWEGIKESLPGKEGDSGRAGNAITRNLSIL